MIQKSAAIAGFIGVSLYVWYLKRATLSFKSVVILMISTVFLLGTFTGGVWGDQLSLLIGAFIGLIAALIL